VVGLAAVVLAAGCGGGDERRTLTIPLEERSGSGQAGTAVLQNIGDSGTRIEIAVGIGVEERQPARIYRGSCDELPDQAVHALVDVVEGESVTELDVPLDDLTHSGFVLNVHLSEPVARVSVACGRLTP
jgi:hypothetical protein